MLSFGLMGVFYGDIIQRMSNKKEEEVSLETEFLPTGSGPPFPPPVYMTDRSKPRCGLMSYLLGFEQFDVALRTYQKPYD